MINESITQEQYEALKLLYRTRHKINNAVKALDTAIDSLQYDNGNIHATEEQLRNLMVASNYLLCRRDDIADASEFIAHHYNSVLDDKFRRER